MVGMEICRIISRLRYNLGLTQEEFAERINVSEKTVQRWEANVTVPNAENLVNISREFNISIDTLLNHCMTRDIDEHYKSIFPERNVHIWESYEKNLMTEFEQSIDEGLDIGRYKNLFLEIEKMPDGIFKKRMGDVVFDMVLNAEKKAGYIYDEPSDLNGIKGLRKVYNFIAKPVTNEVLKKRVRGAWYGRICGCLLGKPIEGIRTKELVALLKETNNFPMKRYIRSTDITSELCEKITFNLKGKCWADTILCAPQDDDTNYTVLASILIDKYGKDFTASDVLDLWVESQSKNSYCTAERVAWKNYVNGYCPPDTAAYKNPYREWIGAQIRGDYFGYINPGNAEYAAEMAWRDASASHIKNGIYGEMFVAAAIACAAVSDNILDVIMGGLAQIPSSSRLYENIINVVNWYNDGICEKECRERIQAEFDENTGYGWCHTIPNAMIVVMALLYNNNSYGGAICSAVQSGFDTDCNGATVGSIFGMLHGIESVGKEWTDCINGKLQTGIITTAVFEIEELIQTTMKHIRIINKDS